MTTARRLSRAEFVHALRHGLGRARLDVRRHGLGDRLPLLVRACLRGQTLDVQLEGSLAWWLLAVAEDGGAEPAVRRAVLRRAARRVRRREDARQIADLLKILAHDGDRVAGRALLRMVDLYPADERYGAEQAVVALGERGWLHVARSFGRRRETLDPSRLSWVVHAAETFVGRTRARGALDRAAARDPAVARFRAAIEEQMRWWGRRRPERPVDASLERLEALVRGPHRRVWFELSRWRWRASRAAFAEAWERAAAERLTRRLRLRLLALDDRRPPRSVAVALRWAQHDDAYVRRLATRLLARARDPRVRRFASSELRRDPERALRAHVADLFVKNGRATDHDVLLRALDRARSREARHNWASAAVDVAEHRRGRAWDAVLLRAWHASPCRFCRWRALEQLVQRGAAPAALLRESLWDADEDCRKTARAALRRREPPIR